MEALVVTCRRSGVFGIYLVGLDVHIMVNNMRKKFLLWAKYSHLELCLNNLE
jgi:hypothetical protein